MSDHDPLCRRAKIMESLMEGCPECALIARVREDAACKCKFWSGYAAGVKAARDAVEALSYDDLSRDQGPNETKRQALAAIDALTEDRGVGGTAIIHLTGEGTYAVEPVTRDVYDALMKESPSAYCPHGEPWDISDPCDGTKP